MTPGIATLGSTSEFLTVFTDPIYGLRLSRVPSFAAALADVANAQKVGIVSPQDAQTLTEDLIVAQQATYSKDAAHEQRADALIAVIP